MFEEKKELMRAKVKDESEWEGERLEVAWGKGSKAIDRRRVCEGVRHQGSHCEVAAVTTAGRSGWSQNTHKQEPPSIFLMASPPANSLYI